MLLITQANSNTIYPTLQERVTLSGTVYFLMRFINGDTLQETACIAAETPTNYTYRYNKLTITEMSSPSDVQRQNGNVMLQPAGWWTYEVYEQSSATNLDYTLAHSLLETGKMKVLPATEGVVPEYSGGTSQTLAYSG